MPDLPKTADELVENTPDLPVMPAPVLRVMQIAGDPTSSASHLAEAICAEPSLAARVLRFANSAYYGMPGEVTTIRASVVLLGTSTVKNLAMIAATRSWFADNGGVSRADAEMMWEHAVATGTTAGSLAGGLPANSENEAFCAGLLHDMGKVVLAVWMGDKYFALIERGTSRGIPAYNVERSAFGFDHSETGYALGRKWKLPEKLLLPIRYHHEPNLLDPAASLVDIVHVADYLHWKSLGGDGEKIAESNRCYDAFVRLDLYSSEAIDLLVTRITERRKELLHLLDAA